MFLFFLNILQQNAGNYVCVQVLQTLNILFENLQHETSLCEYRSLFTRCVFLGVLRNRSGLSKLSNGLSKSASMIV